MPVPTPSRRALLAATSAAGLTGALTACGDSGDGEDAGSGSSPGASSKSSEPTEPSEDGGTGGALASTADVPEGGGTVLREQKIVVTQPTAGEFKAFSAECTHQGCLVADVADGAINCSCHGSKFSLTDGSVQGGPAPRPLPAERIRVQGEEIRLA